VQGTAYDFHDPRPVPLDPTLDLNFCLSDKMRPDPVPVATLRGPNGTTLNIATTCPGLQVYTGADLPARPIAMADSPALAPYAGIALEPQHWPDALHHKHFPQIMIRPAETYRQISEYRLRKG
jgi:aldose 1-epimerase